MRSKDKGREVNLNIMYCHEEYIVVKNISITIRCKGATTNCTNRHE
jgi:hypothetical protein